MTTIAVMASIVSTQSLVFLPAEQLAQSVTRTLNLYTPAVGNVYLPVTVRNPFGPSTIVTLVFGDASSTESKFHSAVCLSPGVSLNVAVNVTGVLTANTLAFAVGPVIFRFHGDGFAICIIVCAEAAAEF